MAQTSMGARAEASLPAKKQRDVIVVGSGPGGATLARELARGGKDVILLEVLDQTAAVKVVAWWGIDYLHLAKYEGEWKVIHVLWQTFPPG